jgi:hypothetical protein
MNHENAKTEAYMETSSVELRRLKDANPADDAKEAIHRNDLRFLAVRGYTITVPGINDYQERFATKYKYRIIEGTSDAVRNDEDRKLQNSAVEYAKAYNLVIRDYLAKQK